MPDQVKDYAMGFSVTKQITLLLSLSVFGALMSGSVFYTFLWRTKADARFVDIAGRQRLRTEQLRGYAEKVHSGQDKARKELLKLVDEFDQTLSVLQRGGELVEGELLLSPQELEDEFDQVKQRWSEFKSSLLLIAARPAGDPQAVRAYALIESTTPLLIEAADQLVAEFVRVNGRLRQQVFLFLGVVVGLDVLILLVGVWAIRNYVIERRQAEEGTRVNLALQRVRNEFLLMRGVEDWGKIVVAFEQELREVVKFKDCGINILDRQFHNYVGFETSAGTIIEKKYNTWPRSLAQASDTGKPVYRRNRAEIDQFEDPIEAGTNCVLDVPFSGGTIAINSTREDAFSEWDIQILEQFAQVLSEAHRRLEDLQHLAMQEEHLHQAQKLEAISQLATGVAHEINNPLTSVLGYSELLLRRQLDPQVREHLETIHQEGERAQEIAARLLQFVRRQKANTQPLSLNELAQEMLALVRQQFELDYVQLTSALAPDLPQVQGHPGQLQQLLLALLQNSREAIQKTSKAGAIQVQTRPRGAWVRLTVEDDGPGIPEQVRERIFEPFFTTKEVGKGTGMGLSLCFAIAREHGGRLWAESRTAGACLVLELPVRGGAVESSSKEEEQDAR